MTADWTEVLVTVDAKDTERAGDIAHMVVPYGIYIEDYSRLEEETLEIAHIDLIDEELLARDRSKGWIHIYLEPEENPAEALDFLRERYRAAGIAHELGTAKVSEEDWENGWKKYFKPLPVGRGLMIQPTWEPVAEAETRKHLWIDPGMAFGTGGHATTKLCMEAIEEVIQPGQTVLDVGCGSGILSIAACLLGAGRAIGVDIDPLAVRTARENGKLNGLSEPRYSILQGDLTGSVTGRYDVVVANIVADVLCLLCRDVREFMNPGGLFILSGIIEPREEDVVRALKSAGLTVTRRDREDGWVCLTAR